MEEKNINVKKLRIPELIDFSFKGQDDKPFVMAIKKYLSVCGLFLPPHALKRNATGK